MGQSRLNIELAAIPPRSFLLDTPAEDSTESDFGSINWKHTTTLPVFNIINDELNDWISVQKEVDPVSKRPVDVFGSLSWVIRSSQVVIETSNRYVVWELLSAVDSTQKLDDA